MHIYIYTNNRTEHDAIQFNESVQLDDSVKFDDSIQLANAACADECRALPRCTVFRFNELNRIVECIVECTVFGFNELTPGCFDKPMDNKIQL